MPTNIKKHNRIFVEFTNFFLGGEKKRDEIEEERLAQPEGPVLCVFCIDCGCSGCAPCTHCTDEPQSTNASVLTKGLRQAASETLSTSNEQPHNCPCECYYDCGDCGGDESAYVSAYNDSAADALADGIATSYRPRS